VYLSTDNVRRRWRGLAAIDFAMRRQIEAPNWTSLPIWIDHIASDARARDIAKDPEPLCAWESPLGMAWKCAAAQQLLPSGHKSQMYLYVCLALCLKMRYVMYWVPISMRINKNRWEYNQKQVFWLTWSCTDWIMQEIRSEHVRRNLKYVLPNPRYW
jgi:hypothetical protein